jgi:hypothetical protein
MVCSLLPLMPSLVFVIVVVGRSHGLLIRQCPSATDNFVSCLWLLLFVRPGGKRGIFLQRRHQFIHSASGGHPAAAAEKQNRLRSRARQNANNISLRPGAKELERDGRC